MENPGANQGDSKTNPFENSSPFSDPEVSEVLAQTLDALDQAIFGAENPFSETAFKQGRQIKKAQVYPTKKWRPNPPTTPKPQRKLSISKSKEAQCHQVMVLMVPIPILWLWNRLCKPSEWQRNHMHNPCLKSAPRF